MKLRTRLFLWVGSLFIVAFGVSLVFENYITDKNLKEAESGLRVQIVELGEQKREKIEEFLHINLVEQQALIDALLLRLSRDTKLGDFLFLDAEDLQLRAPVHSAFLFRNKNWIDFIQSTKNGEQTSLLMPIEFPMATTHYVPVEDHFGWVVLDSDREFDRPLIGVRIRKPSVERKLAVPLDSLMERDWGLTVLFSPESLKSYKQPDDTLKIPEEGDFLAFLGVLKKASEYLRSGKGSPEWIRGEIQSRIIGKNIFAAKPFDRGVRCLEQEGEGLNKRIIQLLQQGDQAIMISVLASLFPSRAFGDSFTSKQAPKGIARFHKEIPAGYSVFIDEVLFSQKFFDDQSYMIRNPPNLGCEGIGSSIAVISSNQVDQLFVGNTLALSSEGNTGFLTIGVHVGELVQNLVFSSGQSAFLVHDGRVVSGYTKEGTIIPNPAKEIPFRKEMLSKKSGLLTWKGQSYYFLHMVPFKNVDLHFFTLEPEKSAFALVHSIDEGSREVIKNVSLNMRLTALVALLFVLLVLHRLSKRITGPIARLAEVTRSVAEGKLEGIELPDPPKGRSDEVATLITSFDQMIVGLREKEKVKAVLNKVVSPEIAQEITKGTIHLGGEERKVTVFFGDIRNFTRMSAEKDPGEVVELLNTCMTKISHQIDAFGGVIDKYVGDEVMALFGAPIEKEDSALKAIQGALKMVEVLEEWNVEREKEGKHRIEMGFGIHTGLVLVGNMGAENRLNYTVIGGNVNFASRLCSAAEGMEILISKETLAEPHVQETINVEECPPIKVKGYDEPFIVYRVKGSK